MSEAPKPSRASVELDRILRENGPIAKKIREHFGRSVLSRLRNGQRLPELETAVKMQELTCISPKGWLEPVRG